MAKEITVLQLYPNDMNIYGDNGNVLVILRRLERYGYTPKHITYNPGRLLVSLVPVVIQNAHGKEHSPVNRFKTIANIGKCPADNDAHRVIEVGLAQFVFDIDGQDFSG